MDNIRFVLGEQRYLEFTIRPRRAADTVVVTAAVWELLQNGEAVDSGNCEVEGKTVRALLSPAASGIYQMVLTVTVPPEVRKERLTLYVD